MGNEQSSSMMSPQEWMQITQIAAQTGGRKLFLLAQSVTNAYSLVPRELVAQRSVADQFWSGASHLYLNRYQNIKHDSQNGFTYPNYESRELTQIVQHAMSQDGKPQILKYLHLLLLLSSTREHDWLKGALTST